MYPKEVYHFLVLHFPIALFSTAFIFDFIYVLTDKEEIKNYVCWTMGMGILWGFFSIISGYITAVELGYIESFFDISSKRHPLTMSLCVSYFIVLFILRSKKSINKKILLFFNAFGVALLMYGAHLGAKWADRI